MLARAGRTGLLFILLLLAGLAAAPVRDEARAAGPGADYVILGFGDSLMAGYGLDPADGFTAQLEAALRAEGLAVTVINAGVSGDTTSAGRARLAWVLDGLDRRPDLVLLELGANDALRGIDPAITRANLEAMLTLLAERNLRVLLIGMRAPPNLGPDYRARFDAIHPELAARFGVCLYPFFLDGVAADPALNQADGIHPNAAGVREIVARIAPVVRAALLGGCPGRQGASAANAEPAGKADEPAGGGRR
ncbi:MAG: arylesterase [Rhodothalassiaceae bacterium]|nr:MAG: arylesterase [Rhodothalassiaceae bacterium]